MTFPAPDATRFVRRVGTGTFFDVAVVEDAGVLVACKRLRPRLLRDPLGRAALGCEVRALTLARHPALPEVLRVGTDSAGPFVLQTLLEGATLEAVRDAWRGRARPLPGALFTHLAREAFRTLAELHELAGVDFVHGDLAPDNVLAAPTGEVRFLDFGMTRVQGAPAPLRGRGTLPFTAPERARGEPADAASDVYALAATLLWLGADRPLVAARDEAATLLEVVERGVSASPAEALRGPALEVFATLARAVRFAREDRITSARALSSLLADGGAAPG